MTKLPRLWPSGEALHPVALSIEMNLAPLSQAQMTLPPEESASVGQWIELYTPHGSAGIFRVESISTDGDGGRTLNLSHGLCSLADSLLPGEATITGTATELMTQLLAVQDRWTLGTVDVPDDVTLTWEINYSNVLQSVTNLLKELPGYRLDYDQTAVPWVVSIRALEDADACECRLTRNMTSLEIEEDRSDLCTRLHVIGLKKPLVLDADTIDTWGVVERTLSADRDIPEEQVLISANRQLEKYKNPALTVQISAIELSQATGDPFDRFQLGSICRVALPEMKQTVRQRVVQIRYEDPLGRPEAVRISLASAQSSIADTVAGLVVDTTVLHKGYDKQKNLLLVAEENILLLSANITSIAESLSFYARKDGVISAINMSPEQITISADRINLEGLVTAEMINAAIASAGGLYADRFTAKRADVTTLYADNFFFSNQALGLYDAIQVCTQSATYYSDTADISYLDWDGNKKTATFATGIAQAQSPGYRTISYLGYK